MKFFNAKKYNKLYNHEFFAKTQYWLKYQIDHMSIPNHKSKENMMKAYLKNYISTFRNKLTAFLETGSYDNLDNLAELYLDTIKDIKQTSVGIAIPKLFLDKYEEKQKIFTDTTYQHMQSIISGSFYTDDYDKLAAILDAMLHSFTYIIVSAESTITGLNGQLDRVLVGTIYDY